MSSGPTGSAADQKTPAASTGVLTKTRTKTQRPPLYKVLLLNDDYTPMEFVVHVLERFFGISHQQAVDIMLTVHRKGLAVVGVFSFEIAETKVTQVMDYARRQPASAAVHDGKGIGRSPRPSMPRPGRSPGARGPDAGAGLPRRRAECWCCGP